MSKPSALLTKLKSSFILAPLVGITTPTFRALCQEFGASLTFIPMIDLNTLYYNNPKTLNMLESHYEEKKGLQLLFTRHTEKNLKDKIVYLKQILHQYQFPVVIDVHMGCSVRKILKSKGGAALLHNLPYAQKIVETLVDIFPFLPITAKIRLGVNTYKKKKLSGFIQTLESAGLAGLTIHGRTARQNYSCPANWRAIAEIKEQLSIPVIANGDITDKTYTEAIESTSCDLVMIGRGAIGDPHIFHRLTQLPTSIPPISKIEQISLLKKYLRLSTRNREAFVLQKKQALFFTRNFRGSAQVRRQIVNTKNLEELLNLIKQFETRD
ncbi:MAG: tRNA dihydrouridine synthase [Candidatus Hodarchaeota archaeon]